jgi:LacI family transcriptional regulator
MAGSARMSDVARLAGVSTMTVSRVLNGSLNVTEGLRQKVFAAIAQLHYQPNELARSLREQRTRQIGVLIPYLFDPFFANCANAISTVAKEHAYSVVFSTSNEDPEAELDEANRMLRRNVEGLIVIPARPPAGGSLLLAEQFERLPIVTLDRPIDGSRFDSVLVENERGACLGTEHLISLGHRRIAYIGLTDELYTMRMRHKGYAGAMQAAKLKTESALVSGKQEDCLASVRRLMAAKKPPTALFCANNLTTRQVLHSLHVLEMHPPESIALVGFDDFETAELLRPGVTVVRQPDELLGRTAAEMMFARLTDTRRPKTGKRIVLPVELIVRGSCGARH